MRLKELRKNKGISQEQVAIDLGISMRAYQNYEYGKREPNIEMILKLAEYYNVTTDYLLEKETAPSPDPFESFRFTKEMEEEASEDYKRLTSQEKAVIAKIVKALADSHKEDDDDYITVTTTIGAETDRRTAKERARKNAKAENAAAG